MLEPETHSYSEPNLQMEITTHDRTREITAEDRSYAEDKLAAVARHFDLVARADLEFDKDLKKRREPQHVVKVTLHLIGHRLSDLRAHETGRDLRAVVDLVMDKIDGELVALKEQVRPHP